MFLLFMMVMLSMVNCKKGCNECERMALQSGCESACLSAKCGNPQRVHNAVWVYTAWLIDCPAATLLCSTNLGK